MAPLIAVYHPVFATFQKKMSAPLDDFKFSSDDLREVHKLVINSLSLYQNESLRKNDLNDFRLVHDDILESTVLGDGHSFTPDGNTRVFCKLTKGLALRAVTSFTEIKNEIGEGGSDPIHQAQCDYVAYYSAAVVGLLFFVLFFRFANSCHFSTNLFEMYAVVPHFSLAFLTLL